MDQILIRKKEEEIAKLNTKLEEFKANSPREQVEVKNRVEIELESVEKIGKSLLQTEKFPDLEEESYFNSDKAKYTEDFLKMLGIEKALEKKLIQYWRFEFSENKDKTASLNLRNDEIILFFGGESSIYGSSKQGYLYVFLKDKGKFICKKVKGVDRTVTCLVEREDCIYFATVDKKVYILKDKQLIVLFKTDELVWDMEIFKGCLMASSICGKAVKYRIEDKKVENRICSGLEGVHFFLEDKIMTIDQKGVRVHDWLENLIHEIKNDFGSRNNSEKAKAICQFQTSLLSLIKKRVQKYKLLSNY